MARKSQNYPKAGEDNKTFMRRCMRKKLKAEGKPRAQAVAICLNMWRAGPVGKSQKKALQEVKQNMQDVVDARMSRVNE
jgi:hypothetical protein